jgi:hypothetical protein
MAKAGRWGLIDRSMEENETGPEREREREREREERKIS